MSSEPRSNPSQQAELKSLRKNMPKFPIIWLGPKCGVMHFRNLAALNTAQLLFFGPLLLEGDSIIDSEGQEWTLFLNKKPNITLAQRIKVLIGNHVEVAIDYGFLKSYLYDFEGLKQRLITQSANDPGDLMWQFIEHDDIVQGVNLSQCIGSLFQFLELKVCNEP